MLSCSPQWDAYMQFTWVWHWTVLLLCQNVAYHGRDPHSHSLKRNGELGVKKHQCHREQWVDFCPQINRSRLWNIQLTDCPCFSTVKPRTPTLVAVNKSNGNFEVFWKTNTHRLDDLNAVVTYYRKGDTKKVGAQSQNWLSVQERSVILTLSFSPNQVSEFLNTPPKVNGYMYYGINGQNLMPNTIYVVSVRSHTNLSNKFSDRSNEREFTSKCHLLSVSH